MRQSLFGLWTDAIAQLGNIAVIGCKQAFLDKICTLIQQPG